jgi:hypothetical protein
LTNWEAPVLTFSQQAYAAIDAWACVEIYNHLCAGKFHPEECPYHIDDQTAIMLQSSVGIHVQLPTEPVAAPPQPKAEKAAKPKAAKPKVTKPKTAKPKAEKTATPKAEKAVKPKVANPKAAKAASKPKAEKEVKPKKATATPKKASAAPKKATATPKRRVTKPVEA